MSFQLQLSRINLDPVLEIQGAPRPQGPKARPLGRDLWFKREEKSPEMWFFQRLHWRNVWLSKMFKLVYVFCFIFCFKTDGWDSPKKSEEAKARRFSSNNIRQLRLKRSRTAWTMPIDERSGATEKTVALVALGWSNWTPLDLEQPLETWSSFQCTVTNDMLLHAEMQKCIMSWWPILSRILLLDICLPLSCKLRYARKGMSKGETNVCTSPKWAAKVESLSMLNPNRQAEGRVQRWLSEEMWHKVGSPIINCLLRISSASRDRWSFRPFTSASGSPWAQFRSLENYPFQPVSTIYILVTASVSYSPLFASFCDLSSRMGQRGSRNILQQSALIFQA